MVIFTKETFTTEVERIARKDKLSYASSIIELCLINDLDVRDVKSLIAAPLLVKLEAEARDRNVIMEPKVLKHAFTSFLKFDGE